MSAYIAWIVAACLTGFAVTALFVGKLSWPRRSFLVPYVTLVCVLLYVYSRSTGLDVAALLTRQLPLGIVAMLVVSVILVRNVLSQPATPRSEGSRLAFELAWFGLVYGAIDGLFLSVFPVVLVSQSFPGLGATPLGMVAAGGMAIVTSALVTTAYHIGYPEFRRPGMIRLAIFGNSVITLAYLLSGNPIAAIGSHAIMHAVAVWRGSEGTAQLPPHYASETAAA